MPLPISYARQGAIRFLRIGRLNISWSVSSRPFRYLKGDTSAAAGRARDAETAAWRAESLARLAAVRDAAPSWPNGPGPFGLPMPLSTGEER